MKMNLKLRTVVIGLGNMVQFIHFPIIEKLGLFEIVGVYDPLEVARETFNKRFPGYPIFSNLSFLLDQEVNVAVIIVPPQYLNSVVEEVYPHITHGIFCEKPLGIDREESQNICDRFSTNIISFCGFNRRFFPYFQEVKKIIKKLGPIQLAEISFYKHLNDRERWRATSNSLFITEGCHAVDLLNDLLLSPVVTTALPLPSIRDEEVGLIAIGTDNNKIPWVLSFNFGSGNQHFSTTLHFAGSRVKLTGAGCISYSANNQPDKVFDIRPNLTLTQREGYLNEWLEFENALKEKRESASSFVKAKEVMTLSESILQHLKPK